MIRLRFPLWVGRVPWKLVLLAKIVITALTLSFLALGVARDSQRNLETLKQIISFRMYPDFEEYPR